MIDWDSDDIKKHGYYYATFGEISVECYNADKAPGTNKGVSYTYDDSRATNDTVVDGDKPTVLKSFSGTGLDMDAGGSSASASGSSTATGSSGPVASIPGGTAQGPGANGEAVGGSSGDGSSSTTTSPDCQQTGFTQNCGSGSSGSGSSGSNSGAGRIAPSQDRFLGASAFAVVVAFIGLLWL